MSDVEYTVRLEQNIGQPLIVVRRRCEMKDLPKVVPEACGLVWNVVRPAHYRRGPSCVGVP